MNFKTPEYEDTYKLISNNKALKKVLQDNGVLITNEEYYELYGSSNPNTITGLVKIANNKAIKIIVDALIENSDYIIANTAASLVRSNFLKTYFQDKLKITSIPKKVMQQIFYTYKYSYTNAFFENNLDKFIPSYDMEELEDNESAHALLDIFMKEFDKISNILDNVKDFTTYEDIPFEYINYLTQLLGLEQKQFMIEEDQEYHFREIARNIIDIYKIKGTSYSYELFFDFLGLNANIKEYYWDRRLYYKYNDQNEETSSNKKYSHSFYLTETDPRLNLTEKLCIDESITDGDMGEQKNIYNFDDLVTKLVKYGNTQTEAIKVLLGYNDQYINEDGEIDTWTGDIYTYFKTNYISLNPTKAWGSSTITTQQSYQITKLVNFLTPIFMERDIIIDASGTDSEEDFSLNWDRDGNFYFLDSEIWECNLSCLYKLKESKGECSYTSADYIMNSNGTISEYSNSLGCSIYCSSCGYSESFKMPIDSNITIKNTSKYWGIDKPTDYDDGYKCCCCCHGKGYPFAIKNTNYWYYYTCTDSCGNEVECCNHYYDNITPAERLHFGYGTNCELCCESKAVQSVLYYPRDKDLAGSNVTKLFETSVEGNGYISGSIRDTERTMCNYINIDWITDCSIADFISCGNDEFNEKTWIETDNRYWECIGEISDYSGFINKYNVINYDYINEELVYCCVEPNSISFSCNDGILRYTGTDKNGTYESEFSELLNNSAEISSYYLVKCNNKYRVYYNISDDILRVSKADISCAISNSLCSIYGKKYILQDSYTKAIEELKCNKAKAACTNLAYVWRPVPEYSLSVKGSYCETYTTFGKLYAAFCNYSTYAGPNSLLCCQIYNKATIENGSAKYTMFYAEDEGLKYSMTKQVGTSKRVSPGSYVCLTTNNYTYDSSNFVAKENLPSDSNIGDFAYIKNIYSLNSETQYKTDITTQEEYQWFRQNHLMRYVFKNRKVGQLIYSTKDGKLYKLTNFGYTKDENVFGVKEVTYLGRMVIDGDSGKIYEYDKSYQGYDESDDLDNNILLNNSRHIVWSELGKEWGTKDADSELLKAKRPVKYLTDKEFEENTEENDTNNTINIGERLLNLLCEDSVEQFKYIEINGDNQ